MHVKFKAASGHVAVLLAVMCFYHGCTLSQKWSENYALLPGVTASDPALIDGKADTIGQSQRKKGSGSAGIDLDIPSEAIIYLPEKKSLYRIVIHATNLVELELMAYNSRGEWDKIHDLRGNTDRIIDIRLRQVVTTTGIKLIVQRTTEDAAQRGKNIQRRGRTRYITGPTTALAKIAEIELYGFQK